MHSFRSVSEAFAWVESFANFERQTPMKDAYRLDRMAAMLADFGHPQLAVPAIHIAGSKGKGTCTHWIAATLGRLGYRVGRYTSPHLADWRERISLADGFFPDECYLRTIGAIRTYVEGLGGRTDWPHGDPTTFELLTLAAWLIFREQGLDWMVIETGLGGLLDATNLMRPVLCLITTLELEHTDILGDTIEEIAHQKAGIFKPGALLVAQTPDDLASPVAAVLEAEARRHGGNLAWVQTQGQDSNQMLVKATLELLRGSGRLDRAKDAAELDALANEVFRHHRIPGRLEWFDLEVPGQARRMACLLLDVAHTPTSVRRALTAFNPNDRDLLVFGSVLGKRHDEMAAILGPAFCHIIITTPGAFKKSDPELVWQAFRQSNSNARLELDTHQAGQSLMEHLSGTPGARVLVCGSFYLAGALLPMLQKNGYRSTGRAGEQETICP